MNYLSNIATQTDDFRVEYDVSLPLDEVIEDTRHEKITQGLSNIDALLDECSERMSKVNRIIDNMTNHADKLDYIVAVSSGVLTGLIDSFFVGKLDLSECHNIGSDKVNGFVKKIGGDENLDKAIKNLEEKTKRFFPGDSNINDFGGGLQHHLRDFSHHPTLIGLVFSLLTQFSSNCYGTNTAGAFICAPVKDKSRIGETIPLKIVYGTLYWFLHLVSDMAGTAATAGGGTGLPGPLLSLAKELSSLPIFKDGKIGNCTISEFISKLFNGTLFAQRDSSGKIIKESVVKMDLRTEIGMLQKQALPVIINEMLVRVFYSIRRFVMEFKEKKIKRFSELKSLNWRKIIPIGNRTVARMLTIASGTFVAVDLADASIRSAIEAAGTGPAWAATFIKGMILRVNFVGIGRFAIAVGTEFVMDARRKRKRTEQIKLCSEMMMLTSAKLYYKEADMWISAGETGKTIEKVYAMISENLCFFRESWQEILKNLEMSEKAIMDIRKIDPKFADELTDILEFE